MTAINRNPRKANRHMPLITERDEIGLFLLINHLLRTGRNLEHESLLSLAECKLPGVAQHLDDLVQKLLDNGLAAGTPQVFTLTLEGTHRLEETTAAYRLPAMFYDAYYQAVLSSPAHAEFCRRVYGIDLCQHGMADMDQIHQMLAELQTAPGLNYLDFGCGDGRISEYISDITGMNVTGIDIAAQAVQLAQERTKTKKLLNFICSDLARGGEGFPQVTFDRIGAVDSFFFAPDQPRLLDVLLGLLNPGGLLAVFYICPPELTAESTVLGQALKERQIACSVRDLSAENRAHWLLKKQVLLELEPAFRAEGSSFLFKNRMAECGGLEDYHRFLYIIPKPE